MATSVTFDLFARDHASGAFMKVGQAVQAAGRHVDELGAKSERLSGHFAAVSRVGPRSFGLLATGAKAAGLALGGAAVAGGLFGLKTAASMEQARISFTTMLGGAKQADVFLRKLQKFAAATPFEFPELQTAASSLISAGINANKVIPIMRTLGDVTSGMGTGSEGVQRATIALQQMSAAGKITGEDLNQLRDAGIPVFDLLASATGKSKAQVVALAQAGKLGSKELGQLMKALETGKGLERFSGLMEKQSQSLTGLFSTLKDNVSMTLSNLITPAIPAIKSGLNLINSLTAALAPKLQAGFGAAAKAIGIVIAAFKDPDVTSLGFAGFLEQVGVTARRVADFFTGTLVPGVRALGAAFSGEGVTSDGFVGVMEHIGVAARAVAGFITTRVVPALRVFGGFVAGTVLPAVGRFAEFIGPIVGRALAAFGRFITGTAIPALRQFGGFITGTVVPAAQRLWGFLAKNLGPTFSALGTLIVTRIWPALQGLFVRFQQVWPTVQTLLIVLGRLALIILKVTGVILGLAIIILGRVLPVLIRLAGPVLTLLFAAIGKVIGVVAALVRVVANAAARIVSNFLAMAGGVINAAAKAFGWVPGLGPKLKGAAAEFNRFRDRVNASLSGVKSRKVTVTAALIASQAAARTQGGTSGSGGRNIRFAVGGPVFGAGSATSDSIPAMLSNGEHVLTAKEVRGLGGHAAVEAIRQQARGFAAGGPVGLDVRPQLDGLARFNAQIGAFNARVDAMARKLAAAQAVAGGATGRAPGAVGGNAKLGQALAAQLYGWTGGQWSALFNLWQGESGWNNNAQNPSSTAYGIAQFLNSTWGGVGASKTSDPRGQIVAGLRYISQSYGTPANAYGKWLSRSPHWYGSGGVIREPVMGVGMRSGSTYGFGERGPETVTPGVGGPGAVHIHIHGAVGDKQAVIGWVQQGLREAQRKAGKPVTV